MQIRVARGPTIGHLLPRVNSIMNARAETAAERPSPRGGASPPTAPRARPYRGNGGSGAHG